MNLNVCGFLKKSIRKSRSARKHRKLYKKNSDVLNRCEKALVGQTKEVLI